MFTGFPHNDECDLESLDCSPFSSMLCRHFSSILFGRAWSLPFIAHLIFFSRNATEIIKTSTKSFYFNRKLSPTAEMRLFEQGAVFTLSPELKVGFVCLLAASMVYSCLLIAYFSVVVHPAAGSSQDHRPFSGLPPNGLLPEEVPMFVSIGFDDNSYSGLNNDGELRSCTGDGAGVTWVTDFFRPLRNPIGRGNAATYDGKPARVTFFPSTYVLDEGRQIDDAVYVKRAWRTAYEDMHEVGSHGHNHTDGFESTKSQWRYEVKRSTQLLSQPFKTDEDIYQPDSETGVGIPRDEIVGFRAPYLSVNKHLFEALQKSKTIVYDSSCNGTYDDGLLPWPYTLDGGIISEDVEVDPPDEWKHTKYPGLWEMPVNQLWVPPDDLSSQYDFEPGFQDRMRHANSDEGIIAFDYNMWYEFKMNEAEFLAILKYSLDLRLQGGRAPFTFGAHSDYYCSLRDSGSDTTASDWREALEEFILYALSKPDVRVVPYRTIIEWMRNPHGLNDGQKEDWPSLAIPLILVAAMVATAFAYSTISRTGTAVREDRDGTEARKTKTDVAMAGLIAIPRHDIAPVLEERYSTDSRKRWQG